VGSWREGFGGVGAAVFGAIAIVICCGGPLLLVAIATTGVGTALAALGWGALGLAVALAGVLAAPWWWLRRRSARERASRIAGEVTHRV
jgi:hypothetical protein